MAWVRVKPTGGPGRTFLMVVQKKFRFSGWNMGQALSWAEDVHRCKSPVCQRQGSGLLDHLVGADPRIDGYRKAERLGGLEVGQRDNTTFWRLHEPAHTT